ncbi:hypothetical protein WJX84_006179 [Apatococcus fuscideae]|uniref:SAP30-binding protein n=1 Tax=Apatococcus fuscideae TaxID=2026836 RepID=A0AAW1SQL2_9CHLO
MAGALGGLIDAYVDSDDDEPVAQGTEAELGDDVSAGRVLLAPTLPTLSAAPPTSPLPPTSQLGLTPPLDPTDAAPDGLGSGDILTAMQQQQQRRDQQAAGVSSASMGLSGTAASGVPLSPGLAREPGGESPMQGVVGDGAAARTPEPEPDLSLPDELPSPPTEPCAPALQALISKLLDTQREQGQTLNNAMKSHRDYRNPNFLQKMVEFCDIQQYGSLYPNELWDPSSLPAEDHSDALLDEHAQLHERRHAERAKRGTVEFTPAAGTAARTAAPSGTRQIDPRTLTQAVARTSASLSSQATTQGASKRSKWDHAGR